jgi:predicted anti-sigma-YlaC factor YlaD
MNCEQVEERLSAYLDEMLTLEERQEIVIHLQACSLCMVSLAELRQNDMLLAQLPRVSPRPVLHERLFSSLVLLELAGNSQSHLLLSDKWACSLAFLRKARRVNHPYLVALPSERPIGLYRCTQRRAARSNNHL